jgi:hypothetical protein
MGLSDVSGIFSRYFIVGFFLPAFFALMMLAITVTDHLYPTGYQPRTQEGILVLGGAALLLGLLLLGLNYPIIRVFEGYPLRSSKLAWLERRLVALQERTFDRIAKVKELALKPDATVDEIRRGTVAWRKLDWGFPDDRSRLLPTRFGNAILAFEYYPFSRWQLDPISTWSRIEPLLSDQERELLSNAKTDVAFFVNSTLGAVAVGITLIGDEVAHGAVRAAYGWLYVLPFVVAYMLYRFAIGAAQRWGTETRASIDLNRLELYERIGVRAPHSFSDERTNIARPLNRFFLFAEQLPDDLWADQKGAQQMPSTIDRVPRLEEESDLPGQPLEAPSRPEETRSPSPGEPIEYPTRPPQPPPSPPSPSPGEPLETPQRRL